VSRVSGNPETMTFQVDVNGSAKLWLEGVINNTYLWYSRWAGSRIKAWINPVGEAR
jgi:hypothetical protein